MHDGTVQQADSWLSGHLASYVRWAASHDSLLIVTWDEDDGLHGNHIATLFVGPMVRPGHYGEFITHDNVLRTIEAIYGLSFAGKSAHVPAITDIWLPAPAITPIETFVFTPPTKLVPEGASENALSSEPVSAPASVPTTGYYLDPQEFDWQSSLRHGERTHIRAFTRSVRNDNSPGLWGAIMPD
jgi:hypothetical protein